MKYVLAISGGVDSVVLLDMVVKNLLPDINVSKKDLIVAHFDHGIRDESSDDAKFVANLAKKYKLEFISAKGDLSKDASESLARQKRYEFLREVVKEFPPDGNVKIVTAHHQDDLIETILINLIRGTGWRGLTPFWADDVIQPLTKMTKADIIEYANKNDLTWVDDETNFSNKYLRNRVRNILTRMTAKQRQQLTQLYNEQAKLRKEVEDNVKKITWNNDILGLPEEVALEILRKITDGKLTIPQTKRLVKSLQTAKSGDILQPGGKIQIGVYKNSLTITKLES